MADSPQKQTSHSRDTRGPLAGRGPRRARHRRVWSQMLALLGMLATLLLVAPVSPAAAADGVLTVTVTITDTAGTPITEVDASKIAQYRVNISYGCNVADCTDVRVDVAAPELDPYYGVHRKETHVAYTPPYSPPPALTGTLAGGYAINLGTVAAGTNGLIRLDYTVNYQAFALGAGNFFPDGAPIEPDVTVSASNAPSVDGTDTASWVSIVPTPSMSLTVSSGRVATDTEMIAYVRVPSNCWRLYNGSLRRWPWLLCGNSGQATVDLPDKAEYVSASAGGAYDAATHSVTFTSATDAWATLAGNITVRFPSEEYPVTGDECTQVETFAARDITYTYLDGTVRTPTPATATASTIVGNCEPFAKGRFDKTANAGTLTIPETGSVDAYWVVSAYNQANVPGVATITDTTLDQADLPVKRLQVVAGGPADIEYTLDDGTTGTATNVTGFYDAPALRHFASVTATSATLAGPNSSPAGVATTPFTMRYWTKLSPGATPGTRTNTASGTITYPDNPELGTLVPANSPDSQVVTLQDPPPPAATPYTIGASNLSIAVTGGGTALVGGEVAWTGNGAATNVTASTVWTPQYVYLAPVGWEIKPDGASFVSNDPGASFDYRTVSYDGKTFQAVVVTWPAPITNTGSVTLPQLRVKTTPTGAAPAGTNNQTAYFFVGDAANRIAEAYTNVKVTDTTDVDLDEVTADVFSRGSGTTSLAASPAIGVTKEICKPDDSATDGCEWVSDSSVLVGVPPAADSIRYRVTIKNAGNATMTSAVAYDVLPYLGDTGTTTSTAGTPRGSTVNEVLSSVANVGSAITLAYSGSTNPPRSEVYSGPTTGDWSAAVTGARAIRATVGSLAAGESQSFEYVASLVDGSADQVACNSVAVASGVLAPVEPAPVCATTQEADLSIDATDRLPLQAGRAGVVPFEVNNGGDSQSATGTVTISVPAEVEVIDLSSAGWDCTAPSTTGPVDVTCVPVDGDGATRSLEKDEPETVRLGVRPTDAAPAELCLLAEIEGLMHDPDPENDTAQSCSTTLTAEPELLVSKGDGRTSVAVGEEFTYTITASSRLVAEPIDGVTVSDTLPDSLEFVSAVPEPSSQSGQQLSWDLGRLEQAGIPGEGGDLTSGGEGSSRSVSVTVRVRAGSQDSITNVARASGSDPADAAITLSASDDDVDVVTNVFTDLGAEEWTPQNASVTTALDDIVSATGAPLDPASVMQSSAPGHGSLTVEPSTGEVTYVPASGYSGDDSYQVRVCDTSAPTPQCFVATVLVHVGVNVVDAFDDEATTTAGEPVSTNVRTNDLTQSGQALADPTITAQPSDGTVVVNANGTVTYSPDPSTSGPDSYSYRVCDTSHPTPVCDTATVSVDVANVWDVIGLTVETPQNTPVATPLDQIVTTRGAPIDLATVAQRSAPAHGSITVDPATGAVTYAPDPGYSGVDSYELEMCDEGPAECSTVTVQVEVWPNVVAALDDSDQTDTGDAVTTDVVGNDTTASGQSLADPTIVSEPAHGSVEVTGQGSITYTPQAGFSGGDSYTYRVCDTSTPTPVCDTATVAVLVRNVFTDLGASATTPHNTAVSTPLSAIVSTTGAPVDPATVSEQSAPAHGRLVIDPVTGAVRYVPEPGYAGPDSSSVRVCDTSTPEPQCFTATVAHTVQPNVVDAVDDAVATGAGVATSITVGGNDTSASGQSLARSVIATAPGHGTAVVNADGTITYTPAAGFAGTDSFTYRVCDTSHPSPVCDTATVTVEVAAAAVAAFDLRLTHTVVGESHVTVGDQVRFRLRVSNLGPDIARDLVLKDSLPEGIELVTAGGPDQGVRADGWTCRVDKRADKLTCTLAGLAPGKKSPPVIVVGKTTPEAVGKSVNLAKVRATGDTAWANNRARAGVRASAPPPLPGTGFRPTIPTQTWH